MPDRPTLVTTLEELLVHEFRTCQNLHNLTKDERQALVTNDLKSLAMLVEHKEALLDELGQMDDQRRMVVRELAGDLNLSSDAPTIADVSAALQTDLGNRLNRLREGIVALTSEIRDLTSGNQALAYSALERADALQSFLLDLYRPKLIYQPPGMPASIEAGPAWGVDQRT